MTSKIHISQPLQAEVSNSPLTQQAIDKASMQEASQLQGKYKFSTDFSNLFCYIFTC
jgi:hypothetical protein